MALVAKYRLGGAAMWTLGMEEMAATNEIRTAALAIAPDPVVNTLSLENVIDSSINYGSTFTVKGLITLKDKTPIAGLNVAVEIKRPNETAWTKIADLVTAADGTVSTQLTLGSDASINSGNMGASTIGKQRRKDFSEELASDRSPSISDKGFRIYN
jgi:hypothetical protein